MTVDTIARQDHGSTAVLLLDYPNRSMNVVDDRLLLDLRHHFDDLLDDARIEAVVLASGKEGSFGAGADVGWLPELAARPDAEDFLERVHELMLEIVGSPKPLVTALNGIALGGAFELALATRRIIATPNARLGFPEITLHLLPGGGGTQLIRRFTSTEAAAELLTTGRPISAERARELGIVSDVVPQESLLEHAIQEASEIARLGDQPEPAPQGAGSDVVDLRRQDLEDGGPLGHAERAILDVLKVGITQGVKAGLEAERQAFIDLLRSHEARAAIHLFEAEARAARNGRKHENVVKRLGVVGAGQMGAGVAATAVFRGLDVVVRDVDQEALERAHEYVKKVVEREGSEESDYGSRFTATAGWDALADTDAVIEAVFELPEVKNEVLQELSGLISPDALIGSNTSAIRITELAKSVQNPERFLGMHFFNPVDRMQLVELIPHEATSQEAVKHAQALGHRLGKIPVVVGDAPGFFTSRVYARWLVEGIRLLLEGVPATDIDRGAKMAGFPVGPMRAHDYATLDLVVQASITQVAERVMSDRLDIAAARRALEELIEAGYRGRRHGVGFYEYDSDGRQIGPNGKVSQLLKVSPTPTPAGDIGERLLLAFATECFLCWDDGTLCHPNDGDLASVLGIGFPKTLGGPFHWADEQGAETIVARCQALGPHAFPTGSSLLRHARGESSFATEDRRPMPFSDLKSSGSGR